MLGFMTIVICCLIGYHTYLKHKEKMKMIEKGIPLPVKISFEKSKTLLVGIICISLGTGNILGALLQLFEDSSGELATGILVICLGIALIIYNRIPDRKE